VWYDCNGSYFTDGDDEREADGVGLLNATLSHQPIRLFELRLTGTNLTDKRFCYFRGMSTDPTEAYPGLPFQGSGERAGAAQPVINDPEPRSCRRRCLSPGD
jgi:hypothetical protein